MNRTRNINLLLTGASLLLLGVSAVMYWHVTRSAQWELQALLLKEKPIAEWSADSPLPCDFGEAIDLGRTHLGERFGPQDSVAVQVALLEKLPVVGWFYTIEYHLSDGSGTERRVGVRILIDGRVWGHIVRAQAAGPR